MNKKAVELIRVSTKEQAGEDRAGIPAQRAANRKTAAQHSLNIVGTFELADVSGTAILQAPEMQDMLRAIESPEITGVVAKEFSRLMRPENYADYAILQHFSETNTVLYLPEGPIDFSSKSGRLLGTIRAAIAGLERTEMLERVFAGKEEKRRAGKHPNSPITLPFGVSYDKQKGWFYTPEAQKVREAFRLVLSGEMNWLGIGKKLGISPQHIRLILRNPIYTGWKIYDKRRDPSPGAKRAKSDGRQADRPKIARAPEDVIRAKVIETPLVSEEEFRRVQSMMDLKKTKHWRARPEYEHRWTYNGFMVCGQCGAPVYSSCQRRDYYVCRDRRLKPIDGVRCTSKFMRRELLDPALDCLFADRLTDRGFLEKIAEGVSVGSRTQSRHAQLTVDLQTLEKKRQRILDSYFEGVIDLDERDRRLGGVERDRALYGDLLMREGVERAGLSADSMAQAFEPFHEWKFLSRKHKRRLLTALVPEIYVNDYKVLGVSLLSDGGRCNETTRSPADISTTLRMNVFARLP